VTGDHVAAVYSELSSRIYSGSSMQNWCIKTNGESL